MDHLIDMHILNNLVIKGLTQRTISDRVRREAVDLRSVYQIQLDNVTKIQINAGPPYTEFATVSVIAVFTCFCLSGTRIPTP